MVKAASIKKSLSGSATVFEFFGLQFISLNSELFEGPNEKTKISKKHKLCLLFAVLLLSLQVFGIIHAIQLENLIQQNANVSKGLAVQFTTYIFMVIVIAIAVGNAFISTSKTRKIFASFERISNIFTNSLQEVVDYDTFFQKFKESFAKVTTCFIISTAIVLAFIFQYNQSNIFLWAVLAVYPYFFWELLFFYFIFLINFVKEHLISISNALDKIQKLHDLSKLSLEVVDFRAKQIRGQYELFNSITKLKTIYGILISDSVRPINDLVGLPIILAIVVLVMGNISACYKVYLSIMKEIPAERIAGKTL